MRLLSLTLQHFRNVPWAELTFTGRQQFFVGPNGQGKTNLLEAAGFVFALRSFRTHDTKDLIAHNQPEAAVACDIEHEKLGRTKVVIHLRGGSKDIECDGEKISRLADYLGRFPTVVFSSQDQQFIRGGPSVRRRWMDLVLSACDGTYLQALQRFHKALEGRNKLLKEGGAPATIASFERPLAEAAAVLRARRTEALAVLGERVSLAHAAISGVAEVAGFLYHKSGDASTPEEWCALWERQRVRDIALRSTQTGPHKDDCDLSIGGHTARDFASEGQQRTLALSLRLAEWEHLKAATGVLPVVLADDVLGELDSGRRARFWSHIGGERQVLATGTSEPDAELGFWQLFDVRRGVFTERSAPKS